MIYRVTHTTNYHYTDPVSLCHNVVHLNARNSPRQTVRQSQLLISPLPAVSSTRNDYFGNPTAFFTIQEPHQRLSMTAVNIAIITPPPLPDPSRSPPWEQVRDQLRRPGRGVWIEATQYCFDSCYIQANNELLAYASPSFPPDRPLMAGVLDLTARIFREFRYDPRATTIATPLHAVLGGRRGVCQDFAHLEIGCLRSLGLAARYISGYLLTEPPSGQARLIGADASHAWLSVFCPVLGWVDVDPTNNLLPSDKHVLLAWGRDYDDVSPIKGVILGGGPHTMSVGVDVVPIQESVS